MACKGCKKNEPYEGPKKHKFKMATKKWAQGETANINVNSLSSKEIEEVWNYIKPDSFQSTILFICIYPPLIYGYVSIILDLIKLF